MNVVTLLTPSEAPAIARATFVFTDVVASTELALRLGDQRWAEVLRDHNAVVRHAVAQYGGEEGAFLGDGFLLLFVDPSSALRCAETLQEAFRAFRAVHHDAPLHLRVGVHTGTACREGRDVYGADVHVASRIAATGGPGEVVLSLAAHQALESELDPSRVEVRLRQLKGMAGAQRTYALRAGRRG